LQEGRGGMSAFSINTDLASVSALNNLTAVGTVLGGTQQQVSTGLRVSGATTDAADFAIAQGVRGNLKGELALANSQAQAQGLLAVTNTAVTSISNSLNQMKTIAVQASSGANTASQLQDLQNQYDALAKQIDTMGRGATYNGANLLQSPTPPGPDITPVVTYTLSGSGGTVQTGDTLQLQFLPELDFGTPPVNSDPYSATVTLTRTDTLANGSTQTTTVGTQTDPTQVITVGAGAGTALTFNDTIPAGVTSSTYSMTIVQTNGVGTANANTTRQTLTQSYTVGAALNNPPSQDVQTATGANSTEVASPLQFLNSTDGSSMLSLAYSDVSSTDLGVSGFSLATNATGAISALNTAITTIGNVAGYYGEQTQTVAAASTFYQSLTDTMTQGLGALVDANLPAQAAQMQAEQTRQQLSAQMLQIANSQFSVISKLYQTG
jgi:flagellin